MANCFRSVSSRLCCTSYLKAANVIYAENTFALRKTSQQPYENWNCLLIQEKNLLARREPFYLSGEYCKKDSLLPRRPQEVSFRLSGARCRQGNEIEVLLSKAVVRNAMPRKSTCVMSSSSGNDEKVAHNSEADCNIEGRPSVEQLEHIFKQLNEHLPRVLATPLPANDYHPEIILENNFKKKRTVGLKQYIYQLALVKLLIHWKFAYVRVRILKITKHPEDGTVKVRWRVVGIPGMSVILQFWKYKAWKLQESLDQAPTWIDGFSIYYVGNDGKIVKHILDKMQPDEDNISASPKSTIAPKVAMFMGLFQGSVDYEDAIICALNQTKKYSSYLLRIVKGVQ